MFTVEIKMVSSDESTRALGIGFYLDVSILHHAIDSKNFETVSVIVRQFNDDKQIEMNREVGMHRWTPLYRAGKNCEEVDEHVRLSLI
jgi:hypothetical protein